MMHQQWGTIVFSVHRLGKSKLGVCFCVSQVPWACRRAWIYQDNWCSDSIM